MNTAARSGPGSATRKPRVCGSRWLGVTECAGRFRAETLAGPPAPAGDASFDAQALDAVRRARAAGSLVPGHGPPVLKGTAPRTPALLAIAEQEGLSGPH